MGVLPKDADEFMRHILNLHANVCERIKSETNEPKQQVRNAFRVWKQKEGRKANVENLLQSLQLYSWQLHAEKIAEELNMTLPDGARKKDFDEQRFDKASKICERKMKTNTDKDFIRWHLGLGSDDISGLIPGEKNFIREGLSKWRKREGTTATAEELVRQLCLAKIIDVAEEICTELKIEIPDVDDDNESMSEHANFLQEEEFPNDRGEVSPATRTPSHDPESGCPPPYASPTQKFYGRPPPYASPAQDELLPASQTALATEYETLNYESELDPLDKAGPEIQEGVMREMHHPDSYSSQQDGQASLSPSQQPLTTSLDQDGAEQTSHYSARAISVRDDDQPGTSSQSHTKKDKRAIESDSKHSKEYNKGDEDKEVEDIDHIEEHPSGHGGKAFLTDGEQDEDKWKTKDSISSDLPYKKHRKKSKSKNRAGHHDSGEFLTLSTKTAQEKNTDRTSDV